MSDVLIGRIRDCLTHYRVFVVRDLYGPAQLGIDHVEELAAEILNAVLPLDDQAEWDNPIWWQLLIESGVCTNCLAKDCGCCVGCGGINADTDPAGTHGYWCGL